MTTIHFLNKSFLVFFFFIILKALITWFRYNSFDCAIIDWFILCIALLNYFYGYYYLLYSYFYFFLEATYCIFSSSMYLLLLFFFCAFNPFLLKLRYMLYYCTIISIWFTYFKIIMTEWPLLYILWIHLPMRHILFEIFFINVNHLFHLFNNKIHFFFFFWLIYLK
jgi:hypothetical protein